MDIRTDFRNSTPVENTQSTSMQSITPAPAQTVDSAADSVANHGGTQQSGSSAPTDGGRETTPKPPTAADIEQMVNERLANDPEYQALQAKLEKWKGLESDYALIDRYSGFITGDGTVTLENIRAVANNSHPDAAEANAAAKRLLGAMDVWNEISKGDNQAGTHDVMAFLAGMRDQLKGMKDSARADIRAEQGLTANPATGSAAAGGAAAGTSSTTADGAATLFKASAPSTKPGMEGAVENINNALTSIGNEMGTLMAKMTDPKTPPEERQKLQAAYNELQQLQSMLMAMYKQLQEAISNMVKMYSEVAQNSIRNMR